MLNVSALNPGVKRREVFAWAMFDFANSGYTTVVLTAVYNAYFVNAIAQKASWATLVLTITLSISYLMVMLLMPAIGRYADRGALKRRVLLLSTLACVGLTALLAVPEPGDVVFAAVVLCLSNFAFSVADSICGAFLPELAKPDAMGRVSGWGWSIGYFGGMLTLALCIVYITKASAAGAKATEFVPVTMLITAAIFAIASLITFVWLKERAIPQPPQALIASDGALGQTLNHLFSSYQRLSHFPDFRQLLFCAVFYQAGIAVVITLSAVYAEAVMKFSQQQTMILIFLVNISSAVGAFAFGYFQDRLGHKRMLSLTILGWVVMVLIAGFSSTAQMFWLAATIAGICMGSSQSCGRALAGIMAPIKQSAEFFGLWSFATRLASILGPITYGIVTFVSGGNHRLGILMTGVFFLIGLWLLRPVNVERGQKAALDHSLNSDSGVVA